MSIEVPGTARPDLGYGVIRRSPLPCGPETSFDGSRTIFETFQKSALTYSNNPCLGYRPINSDGSAQDYVWTTYKEVYDNAVNFGFGLMHLGLCPPNGDGLEGLGFFAKNRPEWVVGEQGCYSQGVVPVPLYDTLGAESVEYVVRQTEIRSIMCSSAELDRALAVANSDGTQLLDSLILMDAAQLPAAKVQELKGNAAEKNVKLYGLMEVVELGQKNPAPFRLPRGKDVAFFCYTSGTTGNPKGALITHESFISCLCGIRQTGVDMYEDDVHLSYLPLPHVFERGILTSCLAKGAAVGFYQGDPLKILDDLQALRPTVFPSVPRLLNRIYDKILQGVDESGGIKKWLFNKALTAKVAGLRNGSLTHSIWDTIVFGPLKKRLGFDRTRIMMTGSAPISGHVLDFLRAVFGCPVTEGYGQTESSLAVTTTEMDDFTCGHVGLPLPCNDIRLEDVSEMGYLTKDTEHSDGSKCLGRGEVCFRGANNFAGYYRMKEKTEETIDSDDWVHTGDIGLWTEDGKLRIIDRKKNIFKLSQGEYVAAEKIENVVARSSLIAMSFIYGDSLQSQLVAVVVPDMEVLEAQGMAVDDPKTKDAIYASLLKEAKGAQLKGFEIPKAILVEPTPFSVDNGLLTPTFKLKRPQARDYYEKEIADMYASLNSKSKL